jgi:hypothetical protein
LIITCVVVFVRFAISVGKVDRSIIVWKVMSTEKAKAGDDVSAEAADAKESTGAGATKKSSKEGKSGAKSSVTAGAGEAKGEAVAPGKNSSSVRK